MLSTYLSVGTLPACTHGAEKSGAGLGRFLHETCITGTVHISLACSWPDCAARCSGVSQENIAGCSPTAAVGA